MAGPETQEVKLTKTTVPIIRNPPKLRGKQKAVARTEPSPSKTVTNAEETRMQEDPEPAQGRSDELLSLVIPPTATLLVFQEYSESLDKFWNSRGPSPDPPPDGYDSFQKAHDGYCPIFSPFWKQDGVLPQKRGPYFDSSRTSSYSGISKDHRASSYARYQTLKDELLARKVAKILQAKQRRIAKTKLVDITERIMNSEEI
jgi:hypothetical protein